MGAQDSMQAVCGTSLDEAIAHQSDIQYKDNMIESAGPPIAILSDIHANLEALTRVLEDADSLGITEFVSLGDVVGYGPDPQACADLLAARGIDSTLGNHENGLRARSCPMDMNPVAQDALNRTACMLDEETAARLRSMPRSLERAGSLMVHALPPDNVSNYIFKLDQGALIALFHRFEQRVGFIGHTHELKLYGHDGAAVVKHDLKQGVTKLDPARRYLVNVGSVGQPRDGNSSAKYLIFWPEQMEIEVRFVEYDIQKTVDKIERLGFSKSLAVRLWG